MTNFEKTVLEELKSLKDGLTRLEVGQKSLEERQKSLELGQNSLVEGQKEAISRIGNLEIKLDALRDQFEEHEAKDANRHVEIITELKELRNDMSTVEVITSKNWNDIAKLKAVK